MTASNQPFRKIDANEIAAYLRAKNIAYRDKGTDFECKDCPNCHKTREHSGQPANQWRLYVTKDGGAFFCHRCGWKGSFYELKGFHGDNVVSLHQFEKKVFKRPGSHVIQFETNVSENFLTEVELNSSLRGISRETLLAFHVGQHGANFMQEDGTWHPETSVTFPYYLDSTNIAFVKARSLKTKRNMKIEPKGAELIPFGLHLVPPGCEEVILTEGEWDAMAIWQATGFPAISLPNGAKSIPQETLQILKRFKKVVIAVDDDPPGIDCRNRLAERLGVKACTFVEWRKGQLEGPKDANDALLAGVNIMEAILSAKVFDHKSITTADDYRQAVYDGFTNKELALGHPFNTLPQFTKLVGGLRMGELTVLSGPTGCGKTALAAQTSIDLAMQGVPTLWGSFEISNEDLICRMLKHMGKKDFSLNIDKFDQTFERLASLPLWFMRFHGATKLEDVIDAMDYAVSVLDVRHIIIDNLQFMIGTIVGNEKFDQQNRVIDMVRDFKKERQIHVSLLAHPRKYDANKEMTEMDLFGSVKLSQDADNVFVIDPTGDYMRFTIRKCRKMGAYVQGAGTQSRKHFHYRFDKASETAVEVDMHHMQMLEQMARQQKARQQGAPQ
jgi:twinkle protein